LVNVHIAADAILLGRRRGNANASQAN